jgi:anthranilate phosphoribosyltransferase
MFKYCLEKIVSGNNLTREEAGHLLEEIITGNVSEIQSGAILTAMRIKTESTEEIIGFLETMESHMVKVKLKDENAIDMCGTGGDGSHSFNISTTASIVVAAGGVSVAKHGNRSISSKCGSADVLQELGVKVDLPPKSVKKCVDELGIGFFFAPLYHPAMKAIAPVRKSLEIRTVFNMLGPLLNPASVRRQLIGTFDLPSAERIAEVLSARKYIKAFTVHSADGLDEVSPFCENHIFEITCKNGKFKKYQYSSKPRSNNGSFQNIRGNSNVENAEITKQIFNGHHGAIRDITTLNAAFGFYVADQVKTVEEGIQLAEDIIDSGKAQSKLKEFIELSNDMPAQDN